MTALDPTARVAVVTGAAGGIGGAVVDRLTADGWRVAAVDVREVAEPGGGLASRCDVSEEGSVDRLAAEVSERLGATSALVNCAGIGLWFRRVGDCTLEEWRHVLDVNLTSCFLMTRAFLPALLETRGAVVNVASVHGVATAPGHGAYATSKAGIFGLTKATSVDYGAEGLRANCLVVGSVDTEMSRSYEQEAAKHGLAQLEIRPWQRTVPASIADVVAFLVSSQASFVNGGLITVDGGLLSWL